eukprot:TRINITY_DN8819_c0_g1_i7.p1 TRINITY_DN8819_c0_g1~~TRINITY_DN8819_c0_g1_i7.p1  ORF type:complete len:118 (-),score=10.86 TRINITY_DN8819_c0_g1_i7:120-473(-)
MQHSHLSFSSFDFASSSIDFTSAATLAIVSSFFFCPSFCAFSRICCRAEMIPLISLERSGSKSSTSRPFFSGLRALDSFPRLLLLIPFAVDIRSSTETRKFRIWSANADDFRWILMH